MRWSMPAELSVHVGLGGRAGSWQPDEEATSINRYMIDFRTWEQRNLGNGRRRSVRLVWAATDKLGPKSTGQIPK